MGITHIKYSWVNFRFKTVAQKYFFNQLLQHKRWRPSRQRPRQFPGEASWLFLVGDFFCDNIFPMFSYQGAFLFNSLWAPSTASEIWWPTSPPTWGESTGLSLANTDHMTWILASDLNSWTFTNHWQSLSLTICRQHGSPDLTYADFIVVQSVWGMTQGLIMPLSGYISRWEYWPQIGHEATLADITILIIILSGKVMTFLCFSDGLAPGPLCCWAASSSLSVLQQPGD